jgi:hypothetical protein
MDNFSSLYSDLSKIVHAYSPFVFLAIVLALSIVILRNRLKERRHQG